MSSSHSLDDLAVTFDDGHLVANAGLLAPATLTQHLGLRELFETHVDLQSGPSPRSPLDATIRRGAPLCQGGLPLRRSYS